MKIKRRNALNPSICAFWIFAGFILMMVSLFIIDLPFQNKTLWFEVIDVTNKSPHILVVGFIGFIIGAFQLVLGFYMLITNDNSENKVKTGKKYE